MKEKSLKDLVKELIKNKNSLVDQYNDKQNEFTNGEIYTANQTILDGQYTSISELLTRFQKNHRLLFKIFINTSTSDTDKEEAKTYLKVNEFYLNSIYNVYLNPINYRLNKLNAEESIAKANESILLGRKSIICAMIIAIFSTLLTFSITIWQNCTSRKQNEIIYKIENNTDTIKTQSQQLSFPDSIYFNSIQTSIDEIIKQSQEMIILLDKLQPNQIKLYNNCKKSK